MGSPSLQPPPHPLFLVSFLRENFSTKEDTKKGPQLLDLASCEGGLGSSIAHQPHLRPHDHANRQWGAGGGSSMAENPWGCARTSSFVPSPLQVPKCSPPAQCSTAEEAGRRPPLACNIPLPPVASLALFAR